MNIVYLIGNGFDLNLGMKTRYSDFCKYYTSLPNDNDADVIRRLKEDMTANIENWSDFELALGKFLDNDTASKGAVILHEHLIDYLQKYIETEENSYIFDKTQRNVFFEYLSYPYSKNRLSPRGVAEITEFISKWQNKHWDVKIITFNYTRAIEKLLDSNIDEKINIGQHDTNWKIFLSAIAHIHGFTDERMILGVNDVSQIANVKLHTEADVVDRYVKSNCNDIYELEHDAMCQQWIKQANMICLFGLSFGDTDKKWWNAISEVLQSGNKAIIFEYIADNFPNKNQGVRERDLKTMIKDKFLSKTTINEDSKDAIKENMYVVFNSDIFRFNMLKSAIETV